MFHIDINPVLTLGPFSVRWYGIFVALAVLVVILWTLKEVRRTKFPYESALSASLVGIPSGIIFARLLHVIDFWQYYIQHPGEIVGGSGLTAWGAVLGASLGVFAYAKARGFTFARLGDLAAPGIILAQAVGRIGCTINGCCYGNETTCAASIIYTHPESYAPIGIPVIPMTIYEIIYNLVIFGILLKLRGRFKPDGSLYLIYLSLYSIWRVGTDFMREGTPFLFGLHQAQVIGIIILIIAIPFLIRKTRWVKAVTIRNEADSSGPDQISPASQDS